MDKTLIKIAVGITYLGMIIINWLATALPINNVTPGVVSDYYLNLFAPAGFTFAIWGVIYLLLGGFVLYSFGIFGKLSVDQNKLIEKVGILFIITSLANVAWIFSWHYDFITLSVVLMFVILVSLIKIIALLSKVNLTKKDYYLIRLPFSVYFGWITIATIANITVFLVSINWNGFGLSDVIWTMIVLLIGAIIGILTALKNKDLAYLLVFIWAYYGILIKHTSITGFYGSYPLIIGTVISCILAFIIANIFLSISLIKTKDKKKIKHKKSKTHNL